MSNVDELAQDIATFNPESKLEPAELAAKLVENGWKRTAVVVDASKLDAGDFVEVLREGDWIPGRLVQVSPGNLLEVDTDRGPWSGYANKRVRLPR